MSNPPVRITGDAGTRSRMIPGEGLVVYFGFALSAAPEPEWVERMAASLGRRSAQGERPPLWEIDGDVLWIGAREVSASEHHGQEVVAAIRQQAREALDATAHPLEPAPASPPVPAPATAVNSPAEPAPRPCPS